MSEQRASNPDLIQRLRRGVVSYQEMAEAADALEAGEKIWTRLGLITEIERLTRERDEARDTHRQWLNGPNGVKWYMAERDRLRAKLEQVRAIAREALAGEKHAP
jgi:hypothetical protein